MATIITEECINCGACLPECPVKAIYEDEDEAINDELGEGSIVTSNGVGALVVF